MTVRRRVTMAFSALVALLGVTLIVETAVVGGQTGFVLGALFLVAGTLRLLHSLR